MLTYENTMGRHGANKAKTKKSSNPPKPTKFRKKY